MANPVVARAEVTGARADGPHWRVTVRCATAAARYRPGHFAALAAPPGTEDVLRRAVPILRADGDTLDLLLPAEPPPVLDLIAPLGTPYPQPDTPACALLLGEDAQAGPLLGLAEQLLAAGSRVGFVLAAPTAERLYGVDRARELTADVLVLTADGSAGLPLDQDPDLFDRALAALDADLLYAAAGPELSAAASTAAAVRGVRSWAAVTAELPCGTGLCLGCVLPVRDADGVSRLVRACTEGPVFDGARVRWGQLGEVPADVEGAGA
ncbi:dihydroorotate dehydrogenase electron transfer subunit [Streptomyces sp. TLI_171]|uniref:iron-sulfur cluster-binding protein n=1 Tax=Streptomyces sp. TLI_171 TaxID=1938859 RepID=UPI000C47229E|nr:dihydroorotate dehydrogenase electron transfer subunit [Streptomyces sp. TLI_171]RKE17999.1 dihydroorotate dehydrogenase electron transfer subunit [Streptomyces sp. TLI_171]